MCSFTVLGGPKTSKYLVWPPIASRSATHLLRIELIRLLIVACGMLVHSSSMAVRSCWILAGTGTRCRIRRSRASQTCSTGDMSGEYAGHARTGMFSASRNCVQILATWGRALSCCNMRWCCSMIMLQQAEVRWSEWATTLHLRWPSTLVLLRAASSAHSYTPCTHMTVQPHTAPTSSSNSLTTQRW